MTEAGMTMGTPGIRGPRPMALHLQNSLTLWTGTEAGARRLEHGVDDRWHASLVDDVKALAARVAAMDELSRERFFAAVKAGADRRGRLFLEGVNAYLIHPYQRPESDARLSLELGECQLLDFGGDGQPVLMVPSLINPHYIFDLKPGRSMAAYLKRRGFRPFLVDWGEPGPEERHFGTSDYVTERLLPFLKHVAALSGGPVPVIGNCMGGTLTVALGGIASELMSRLAILAAPWDFKDSLQHVGRNYAPIAASFLDRLPGAMPLPVDALQTFFTSTDPTLSGRKFRRFAGMDKNSEAAEFFVALETWANTGAPLARKVASECLVGWYRENTPGRGLWQVAGKAVDPAAINCPVWVAAPHQDRLVPQESAHAILRQLKHGTRHDPGAGHIGMLVGNRAEKGLWEPLANWLLGEG
ncbi:MAG: alpha/beta fold hydrolase [Alphaproteobacteria bacterium]|nr:MAG: alpha/beta fold hydrolase [Alphaproteobacteria bacterium]